MPSGEPDFDWASLPMYFSISHRLSQSLRPSCEPVSSAVMLLKRATRQCIMRGDRTLNRDATYDR